MSKDWEVMLASGSKELIHADDYSISNECFSAAGQYSPAVRTLAGILTFTNEYGESTFWRNSMIKTVCEFAPNTWISVREISRDK